jgi:hypothetical protein
MEKSLEHYRELVSLTRDSYLYANSMQTAQRRIPIGGDDGKNKTWEELLPFYEDELANFLKNIDFLKRFESSGSRQPQILQPVEVKFDDKSLVQYTLNTRERIFSDENFFIGEFSEDLKNLKPLRFPLKEQAAEGTTLRFECRQPVQVLVGYFNTERKEYAKAPTLEIDASANQYGQADVKIANAMDIPRRASVNIHSYTLPAGKNTLNLGKGGLLVLGFIDAEQKIQPYNADISGADVGAKVDWLFY